MKNYEGRLVNDPTIKKQERQSDGQKFSIAFFSIAKTKEDGKTEYTNCRVTGKQVKAVENLKKGDSIQVQGDEKEYENSKGELKKYIQVSDVKLLSKVIDKTITGNLASDPEINERTNKTTGEVFKVAKFSIAENFENASEFTSCQIVGKEAEKMEGLSKGDFIKVSGKMKSYEVNKDQEKQQKNFLEVKEVKILKSRDKEKESFVSEMKNLDKQSKNDKETKIETPDKNMGQEI